MEEITSPNEDRLVDKYSASLEEDQNTTNLFEQPSPVAEQPQKEEDEFSDIGDVAREIGSALVGGLQQTGSDLVTFLSVLSTWLKVKMLAAKTIAPTLTSLVHLKILLRHVLVCAVS